MKNSLLVPCSFILLFGISTILPFGCTSDQLPPPSLEFCDSLNTPPILYDGNIDAIVNTYCAVTGCHLSGFPDGDFQSYAGMLSRLDNGKINTRVFAQGDMPPAGSPKMTQEEMDQFQCWISNNYPEN